MKCIQYWPDEGSLAFGKIVVSLKEREPFSDFVIRTFVVTKVQVKHIIYKTLSNDWPKYALESVNIY